MTKSSPPQPQKRPERSNLLLFITLIIGTGLLMTAVFSDHGLMRWLQYNRVKNDLSTELLRIEEVNSKTRQEIASLVNNGKYIEMIARRDLGMVKPDEIIYQFPKSEEKPKNISVTTVGQ